MIEREALVQSLQAIGMSGYEAKAYLALIGAGEPINGYEVAKRSGVPRSTVYETLDVPFDEDRVLEPLAQVGQHEVARGRCVRRHHA